MGGMTGRLQDRCVYHAVRAVGDQVDLCSDLSPTQFGFLDSFLPASCLSLAGGGSFERIHFPTKEQRPELESVGE